MSEDSLNVSNFLNDRLEDIKYLETALNNTRKKTMLFQRLKFYKRRRSRSYTKKKTNTRRKDRHILKTHIWYAKRFKMIKMFNCSLPFCRNIKSSKYIYKSLHRGFVFDESYKKSEIYKRNDEHFLVGKSKENLINTIKIGNEQIEVILLTDYLIICYIEEVVDKEIFEGLEFVSSIDCTFLIMKSNFEYNNKFSFIDSFYISNGNNRGKIFVSKGEAMNVWMGLIKQSLIPVSIQELDRIALEEQSLNYPFDFVQSKYFQEYENILNKDIIDKYERTPKGKRVKIDTKDLFIQNENPDLKYFFFEGTTKKHAVIYNQGSVVGRIIRCDFSFSRGKCRGIGYLYKDVDGALKCLNIGENIEREITILKYFNYSPCKSYGPA